MLKLNKKRGFTLIELLVVIAIIGILASVVLASLNTARDKGKDAAIKASMASVRVQAELYYDSRTPNGYGDSANTNVADCGALITTDAAALGTMLSDTTIDTAIDAADAQSPIATGVKCVIGADATGYAISTRLQAANTFWCVDNTGAAIQTAAVQPDDDVTCN